MATALHDDAPPEAAGIVDPALVSLALIRAVGNFIAVFDESLSLNACDGETAEAFERFRKIFCDATIIELRHNCGSAPHAPEHFAAPRLAIVKGGNGADEDAI